MSTTTLSYLGYRFPNEIISHAVWLHYRFCLSFRDVGGLLAKPGVIVSCETIRQWSRKSGAEYARNLKRREALLGGTWHLDELFVTIQGERTVSDPSIGTIRSSRWTFAAQRSRN
jgi:putative transposase